MAAVIVFQTSWLLLSVLGTFERILGGIITVPVELHQTHEIPCVYQVRGERIFGGRWFKSTHSDVFVEGADAVAWRYGGETDGSHGFNMTDNYSLIVHNINISNKGVFRCKITPYGDADASTYDIKIVAYASPSKPPALAYTEQSNGYQVKCSANNVYPLAFPSMSSYESTQDVVENQDGTYNTTVIGLFPLSKENSTVECFYSNINFKSSASLRLYSTQDLEEFCSNSSSTDINSRQKAPELWIIYLAILGSSFLCVISMVTVMRKRGKNRRNRNENGIPALKWIELLRSYFYFVLTLPVQIIVLVLLVVLLAILHKRQ